MQVKEISLLDKYKNSFAKLFFSVIIRIFFFFWNICLFFGQVQELFSHRKLVMILIRISNSFFGWRIGFMRQVWKTFSLEKSAFLGKNKKLVIFSGKHKSFFLQLKNWFFQECVKKFFVWKIGSFLVSIRNFFVYVARWVG